MRSGLWEAVKNVVALTGWPSWGFKLTSSCTCDLPKSLYVSKHEHCLIIETQLLYINDEIGIKKM